MTKTDIALLFVGMTCRFDGVPFEFEVTRPFAYSPSQVIAHDLVETVDGTRHQQHDCTRVYNSNDGPSYRYASFDWFTDEQLQAAREDDLVVYCDEVDAYALAQYTVYCDHNGTHEHLTSCERFAGEWYLTSSDMIRCDGNGNAFLDGDEDYCYCDDGEYYHTGDCHYCEGSESYRYGQEDECECCCPQTEVVHRYHNSGISPQIYRGVSGWCVGFEVEKNSVAGAHSEGDSIEDVPLFAYWEADGSCGIEGVTHAYDPIDPMLVSRFKRDVCDSADYLDEDCDTRCGGHINISNKSLYPRDLLTAFRVYAPLWYAIYRHRLNSAYCNNDKKIEHGGDKYSPVITKSFGIEIRLPSRVRNADQLLRRFEWVGVTCQAMTDKLTFNQYIRACRPVLFEQAYEGNRNKYANVLRLARKFRIWMLDGVADSSIAQWV